MQLRAVLSPAAVAAVLLLASSLAARTWNIHEDGSGDAPTIQAGIDSASAGDVVLALPGRYLENINFLGKAITVKRTSAELCIIDGSGAAESCVTARGGLFRV